MEIQLEEQFLNSAEDMIKIALDSFEGFKMMSEIDQKKIKWIVTKSIYLHRDKLMDNSGSYFENFKSLNEI
jgi:hypothetical protein